MSSNDIDLDGLKVEYPKRKTSTLIEDEELILPSKDEIFDYYVQSPTE